LIQKQWLSLNSLRTTVITKDIKLNTEEEERERLIIMPEKDSLSKTKTSITAQNTD